MRNRKLASPAWQLWRAFIGIAYLAAAVFNTLYTLPRSDQLDGYAEGAWFSFLEDFMNDVFMPNGDLFMVLVIVFEVAVGILILSRDPYVSAGVTASVVWVIAVLPFLAWPYLLTNIALIALQGGLLFRRYDTSVWQMINKTLEPGGAHEAADEVGHLDHDDPDPVLTGEKGMPEWRQPPVV